MTLLEKWVTKAFWILMITFIAAVFIAMLCDIEYDAVKAHRDGFVKKCAEHRPLVDCQKDAVVLYPEKRQ